MVRGAGQAAGFARHYCGVTIAKGGKGASRGDPRGERSHSTYRLVITLSAHGLIRETNCNIPVYPIFNYRLSRYNSLSSCGPPATTTRVPEHNSGLSIAMTIVGYVVNFLIAAILIVGGYQFYFFVQRWHRGEPIEFKTRIDDLIPFRAGWVWVYSGLYYPVIFILVFTIDSFARFNYTAFSFITLLVMQIMVFFLFPVKIPKKWRNYEAGASSSTRLLAFVHSYDGLPNSIPSMHVSVSTLAALHLFDNVTPLLGDYALVTFAFPVVIAMSCLFTKQHYIVDLAPGALFGYINYKLYGYYVLL
jgi:hypothetical protein